LRPAGVFLNATPSFFRLGEPDLNLKRGFLALAFTNLFQALSLRLDLRLVYVGAVLAGKGANNPSLGDPHSGQYFMGINLPASLP
jgi:hypothetical protein